MLGVHDIEFLAHHGGIEGAFDFAQLLVTGHAIADANVIDALGDILVGWVLCDTAHLFTALGLGTLLGLHVCVVVLLGRGVLGMHNA